MRSSFKSVIRSARKGFSLIEILVAMTILTIIVLIISVIFQQTGIAWTIGMKRATAQSATRAVVGAISRDLAMIVDPCTFVISPSKDGTSLQDEALSQGVLVQGDAGSLQGSLSFWILRPDNTAATDMSTSQASARELAHVKYTLGGQVTRTETIFNNTGDGFTTSSNEQKTTTFDLGQGGVTAEEIQMSGSANDAFSSIYATSGVKLTVRPDRPVDIDNYEIFVGSCGPDRTWGTEDDIRPWVEGEDK